MIKSFLIDLGKGILICAIFLLVIALVHYCCDIVEGKNNAIKCVCETPKTDLPSKYVGEFNFTHYAETGYRTATGHKPLKGRTIAVDPKVIPLNSIVYIESLGYFVAEDTGGAIKGKKIDIYVKDKNLALKLGTLNNKKLSVYILTEKEM